MEPAWSEALPQRHPDDFEIITETSKPTKADENIAALQSRLQSEVDGRREERFAWALALTIALDALILQHTPWALNDRSRASGIDFSRIHRESVWCR